jgi:hypothetical protein
VQLDQVVESLCVAGASRDGWFASVEPPLDIERAFLGVLSAPECLIDIFSFPPNLRWPAPGI